MPFEANGTTNPCVFDSKKNKNGKPLYGLTITGRNWQLVVMEGKKYDISKTFDATYKDDLSKIIAILHKFKVILETTLLD